MNRSAFVVVGVAGQSRVVEQVRVRPELPREAVRPAHRDRRDADPGPEVRQLQPGVDHPVGAHARPGADVVMPVLSHPAGAHLGARHAEVRVGHAAGHRELRAPAVVEDQGDPELAPRLDLIGLEEQVGRRRALRPLDRDGPGIRRAVVFPLAPAVPVHHRRDHRPIRRQAFEGDVDVLVVVAAEERRIPDQVVAILPQPDSRQGRSRHEATALQLHHRRHGGPSSRRFHGVTRGGRVRVACRLDRIAAGGPDSAGAETSPSLGGEIRGVSGSDPFGVDAIEARPAGMRSSIHL